ncbi:hypothetical protein NDU88_003873 [Pleurodeles waltl]|uniref:Uncharacterized protein n=1 Tax=Pleurodeles waltl TaxID=8319 RepID=A0AAV7LIA7_PLEWA|nr:hypothetical protein NDU88_003873 [Pleurodeles waltl]
MPILPSSTTQAKETALSLILVDTIKGRCMVSKRVQRSGRKVSSRLDWPQHSRTAGLIVYFSAIQIYRNYYEKETYPSQKVTVKQSSWNHVVVTYSKVFAVLQ